MGIFEDAIYNARTAAGSVGKKAGKFVDASKLTILAAELNGDISRKCEILGRVVYEDKTTDKNYDKAIAELVEKIAELRGQLDSVNGLIAETKNKVKCPNCSTVNSKSAIFCEKCGKRLKDSTDIDEPEDDAQTADAEEAAAETATDAQASFEE